MSLSSLHRQAFRQAKRLGMLSACTLETFKAYDENGNKQYQQPVSFQAVWSNEQQYVRGPEGQQVWSQGNVVIERPALTITPKDRITLPDGAQPLILSVERAFVHNRLLHQQVFF